MRRLSNPYRRKRGRKRFAKYIIADIAELTLALQATLGYSPCPSPACFVPEANRTAGQAHLILPP